MWYMGHVINDIYIFIYTSAAFLYFADGRLGKWEEIEHRQAIWPGLLAHMFLLD